MSIQMNAAPAAAEVTPSTANQTGSNAVGVLCQDAFMLPICALMCLERHAQNQFISHCTAGERAVIQQCSEMGSPD